MDNSLMEILIEFDKLKGQHVIVGFDSIERLIGVGSDGDDYYYITWKGRSNKVNWSSCVGSVMPMKGHLLDRDYDQLVSIAKLNHWDQIQTNPEMRDKLISELIVCSPEDEIITELCFDLN